MADNEELRNNLVSFKEAFRDYTDCYTLIGGSACFILMDDAGLSFRATHDIDMILYSKTRGKNLVLFFGISSYAADILAAGKNRMRIIIDLQIRIQDFQSR